MPHHWRIRSAALAVLLLAGLTLRDGSGSRGSRPRAGGSVRLCDDDGGLLERAAPGPADGTRSSAWRAFAEGWRWRRQDLSSSQQKAAALFAEAHEAWMRVGDRTEAAGALTGLGAAQLRLDQRVPALRTQLQALALLEPASRPEPCLEAQVRRNLGQACLANDRAEDALVQLHAARERARRTGDDLLLVGVLTDLGASHHALSRFRAAFASYAEALELLRLWTSAHPGDLRLREKAAVVYLIGASYQQQADRKTAFAWFEEALALYRAAGDAHGEAKTLNRLGALYGAMHDTERALEFGRRALQLNRAEGEAGINAYILHNLAWAHLQRREFEQALQHNQAALDLRRRIGNQTGTAASLLRIGMVNVELGRLEAALPYMEEALATVEQIRSQVSDLEFRSSYFSATSGTFEGLVDVLLRLHARDGGAYLARAFEATERSRARGLLDSLGGPGAARPPLTLHQTQRELDPDTVLLQYWLGNTQSVLFLVTRDAVRVHRLPPPTVIEAQARLVHEHLTARLRREAFETLDEREARLARADADYELEAARLSEMILAPAAADLGSRRLLVAPDGMLHAIPFAALPDPRSPGRPLMLAHEIAYVPSASILARIRRDLQDRPSAPRTILVIADPVFGPGDERLAPAAAARLGGSPSFPRLRYTGQEAQTVARLVPPDHRHIADGFAATRALARSDEVARYRIVHFATHALVDNAQPALSGILLSGVGPDGRAQDGLLRASEIVDRRLRADLVVLSSCSTGVGQKLWGEGLLSLTRAFLRAGAARVMVSGWDVDDAATAELMSRFYEQLLHPDSPGPVAALHAAQAALRRDPGRRAPFYWAAFGIQGEYRKGAGFQNSHAARGEAVIQQRE